MPSPTSRGYRYPSSSSAANVPLDIQHLAEDVNADVQTIVSAMATDTELAAAITAALTPEAWHVLTTSGEPNFQNGWGHGFGSNPCKFMKHLGTVHLAGYLFHTGGNSNAVAFQLPVGYRPLNDRIFAVASQGSSGVSAGSLFAATVTSTGQVRPFISGVTDQIMLDGISFRAEQ